VARCSSLQPSPEQRPSLQVAHGAPTSTHSLAALHTCGCVVSLQRSEPGRQPHCPATHNGAVPEHSLSVCHVPSSVHTVGALSAQLRAPGEHSPPHSPSSVHTYEHAVGLAVHTPLLLHLRNAVLGVCGMHCRAPGTHSPPQAMPAHANGHCVAAFH
jgi:hypothetical protein